MEEADIIIIGGGIAGLCASYRLQQEGKNIILLEKSGRVGGLIQTVREDNLVIESGPDAFITRKPWAYDLVKELELDNELIEVNSTEERIYILNRGDLHPMPKGLNLLIPSDDDAFLQSPLFSDTGKQRALEEVDLPPKTDNRDESMANFVRRRFGTELFERLAEPLLAGVYNADAERLSMHATFPQYPALEQKYGSLISGMQQRSKPKKSDTPPLLSFKHGMATLPEALAVQLKDSLQLNQEVETIEIEEESYIVCTSTNKFRANQLVLALPASIIAEILPTELEQTRKALSRIRYEGVGCISLVYNQNEIEYDLNAYGVVIPAIENRNIDGMQWTTSKFSNRAPVDTTIIRVFYGGPNTREMLDKSEEEIVAIVREELKEMLGITVEPFRYFIHSWKKAYPQYDVNHQVLVDEIMDTLPNSIGITGNSYYGVGIPDTIKSAEYAVDKLLS